MSREILLLVDVLAREKNVTKDIVFGALELALAWLAGVAVTMIASIGPAIAASRVRPIEALQSVPTEAQAKRAGKTPEEYLELEDRAAISRRLAAGRAAEYVIGHSTIITE